MGVKGQDQMLVPRFIRVMVMPVMEMGKWVTSERKDKGNYQAMDRGSAH